MTTPARRPWWNGSHRWWNKKRWRLVIAAGVLCAVSAPHLLFGPVMYCAQWRWMSLPTLNALYRPIRSWVPGLAWPAYDAYLHGWVDLGMRHDADMRLRQMRTTP